MISTVNRMYGLEVLDKPKKSKEESKRSGRRKGHKKEPILTATEQKERDVKRRADRYI